jgi:hypothetical protein
MKQPEIIIEINGLPQTFDRVWVHLQRAKTEEHVPYRIVVPKPFARDIFDPYGTKAPTEGWPAFLERMIGDVGTFIVETYIENMGKRAGQREKNFQWVITSVDTIRETDQLLELGGEAVTFRPTAG